MTSATALLLTSFFVCSTWTMIQYRVGQPKHFYQAVAILWIWFGLVLEVGRLGWLSDFSAFPPRFVIFFVVLIAVSFYLAFSKFGTAVLKQATFSNLVRFQAFRIMAEFVLYLAMKEGRAPVQMTFAGYNYDWMMGVSALGLGWYLRKNESKPAIWIFTLLGLLSLIDIGFIAVTSMPVPFRIFMNEPSNVWVTTAPYILLPGVLVLAAFTTHLLTIRKLLARPDLEQLDVKN